MFSPYITRGRSLYRGASGAQLNSTTNLPSSQNFTICGWSTIRVIRPSAFCILAGRVSSVSASPADAAVIGYNSSGALYVDNFHSGAAFGTNYAAGETFFWALTLGAASVALGYARRARENQLQSATDIAVGTFSTGGFSLGVDDTTDNDWYDGEIWNVRTWSTILTAHEVLRESYSSRPVRLTNLHAWWPLEGTNPGFLNDWSGNGNHLAKVGSGTVRTWSLPSQLLDPLTRKAVGNAAAAGSVLSAAGDSTASFTGQSTAQATLSAAGDATGAFVGKSNAASVLSGSADASASFVGRSNAAAVWAASATATGDFVGTSVTGGQGVLSASGDASGIFVGKSLAAAVLAAAGDATAFFIALGATPTPTPTAPASFGGGGASPIQDRYWREIEKRYRKKKKQAEKKSERAVELVEQIAALETNVATAVEALQVDLAEENIKQQVLYVELLKLKLEMAQADEEEEEAVMIAALYS